MWQKFLKQNQGPFLVPPYFSSVKVRSKNGQIFDINLNKKLKKWGYVSDTGSFIRNAEYWEIDTELKRYPSLLCSFIQTVNHTWLVSTSNGPTVLRLPPDTIEEPNPFTRIRASILGTVLVFNRFDHRDSKPWLMTEASLMLKQDNLPNEAPVFLCEEQRFVFEILLENEKVNRIPPTERKAKDILATEGAELISLKETRNGYSVSFNYQGRRHSIRMKEDLMLMDAGMCLSGRDRNYSLDTFLAILKNRHNHREWDPYNRRGWDREDFNDFY